MSERFGAWMQVNSGGRIYPMDPRPGDFTVEDIAHALSNLCRFGGHCSEFYSVAQHSVLVSYIVPEEYAWAGLMHDAAESFLGDMVRPLKEHMPAYRAVEQNMLAAMDKQFNFGADHDIVLVADNIALVTEARDLMGNPEWIKDFTVSPLAHTISPLPPADARRLFLDRVHEVRP